MSQLAMQDGALLMCDRSLSSECCELGEPGQCGIPCGPYPSTVSVLFDGIVLQDPSGQSHLISCGGDVPFAGAPLFCGYLQPGLCQFDGFTQTFVAAGCSTGVTPLGDNFWYAQFAVQVFGQGNAFIYYCRQVLEGDSPMPIGDYPFCLFTTAGIPPWVLIESGTVDLNHA